MGGLDIAEKQYLDMLARVRAAQGPSSDAVLALLDHIGEFYLEARNPDRGYELLTEAAAIARSGDARQFARRLRLGDILARLGQIDLAAELSKLTYHIHVDELRAFLATRPAAPAVLVPDPWALGPKLDLVDLTGEGRAQLLEAGSGQPEEFLFDLDGDTDAALLRARDLVALGRDHKFEAELVLRMTRSRMTAFYDTDNDGAFDLIVSGRGEPRGAADLVLERSKGGRWDARPARTGELILAPERFADPKLAHRLEVLADKLGFNRT